MFVTVLKYILTALFGVLALALIIIVIMQEGKSAGLGTIGGMADTYWEKNKSRSREGILEKMTKFAAIGFVVIAFILTFGFWGK